MLLREAVHVIREPEPFADVEEQTRAHPFAENRVQQVQHVAIGVHVAQRPHPQADVRLLGALPAHGEVWAAQRTRWFRQLRAVELARQQELRGHGAGDNRVVDHAGRADDEVRHAVVRVCVLEDVVARQLRHRRQRAGDVAAQRVARPDQLLEQVLHVLLRLVLVHLQLLEDHRPFALDVRRLELRVRHDVEQHIEPELHVLGRYARPVRGQLLVGGCVDEPADSLDRVGDLLRCRPAPGALEKEVLDEMRNAGESIVLQARTAAEHQDETRREPLRHRSGDEARAAWKHLEAVGGCQDGSPSCSAPSAA